MTFPPDKNKTNSLGNYEREERNDLSQFLTQLNTLTTEEICLERYCIQVIHGMTKQTKWVDFINMYSLNQCMKNADPELFLEF